MAGLFDEWIENTTGEVFSTFSVITTDANEMMAEIHNSAKRMPAILDKSAEAGWLNLSTSPEDVMGMLKPCGTDVLKANTISPLVNNKNANRNTPEVILPYKYNRENLLF